MKTKISAALAALTIACASVSLVAAPVPASCPGCPNDLCRRETPGPIRFMLEVEVIEPDGSHSWKDGSTFDTQVQAVTEVERITRDGLSIYTDPSDPETAGACYPPVRHVRTRLVKVWL